MIEAWLYEREAQTIRIYFLSGHEDTYECTPEQWKEANEALSPGRFVHENFLNA